MAEGCWKIKKTMTIGEVLKQHPPLNRVMSQLGMACCSCMGAETDTLENVAYIYGFDPDFIVHTLNVAILFLREPNPPDPPSKK